MTRLSSFSFLQKITFCLMLILLVGACSRVAVTNRRQFAPLPDRFLLPMSFTNYSEVISSSRLSTNAEQTAMVKRTGERISKAVEQYMRDNKMEDQIANFAWEFNLIADPTINAWCMPGGKVAFYEGIMPICRDETGVAVVMGHEIAHAVAKHGNERMSQGLMQQFGGLALDVYMREKPAATRQLFQQAYGVTTTVGVLLPFSRLQETEADKMGLIFMAMAGYDPREAPNFWNRMRAGTGDAGGPEFLSTHPAPATRIRDLNNMMEEALKYYKK